MAEQPQFKVGNIQFKWHKSTTIGDNTSTRAGVQSAAITCRCGHDWIATEHADLTNAVGGGIIVTCPACHASALVNPRSFHAAP